jgi:hypothetical protein
MNRRKGLVLLVILGLLAGLVGRVPVALADFNFSEVAYGNLSLQEPHSLVYWVYNAVGVVWSGYYINGPATFGSWADIIGNMYYGTYTYSYTVDGHEVGWNGWAGMSAGFSYSGATMTNLGVWFTPMAGSHTYEWYIHGQMHYPGAMDGQWFTWLGSIPGYDTTNYGVGGEGGGSSPGPGVWPVAGPPLSVTIEGPASVDTTDTNTWTAAGAGGTAPYTYLWGCTGMAPFWSGIKTGTTLTQVVPAGVWPLQVTVMDANGDTATAYLTVTASLIAGSYQAHLTRSGAYGQYMSVYVTDAAGAYVTISSTANTKFGIYATSGGAFGWVNADSEAVQYVTYTWRWTMSANFGGATSPPPADFWFQSSIHLAIPNLNLLVSYHFTGAYETPDIWFPPGPPGTDVPQIIPETPPVPTSTLPEWLQPIYDMFVRLVKALFQPDATEFSKQLAGSWVTIASPVPSITPQYTIPFPNPNHLLAPTGDSVNIDFSGIMSYSGYSTYKLIVQVFLDAILVFVVIALVT